MYNTNQQDYIDRSENNIQENIPIIPSEEIDVSLPENLSRLKLMFIEEINNLFNKEKINFLSANEVYKNNYKKSLDLLFDEITKSDAFSKLNNLNDNLAIISNFKKIVHESFDYLPIIFSEKFNWDFDFSSLVFDNSISLSQFKLITNTFNDMLLIQKHEQYFLNELSLLNKNEKFIWLLEQTNTTDEELKIFAKWYAENEVNEYKQDIKIYQNLLVEKLLDYESIFPKKYSKFLFKNFNLYELLSEKNSKKDFLLNVLKGLIDAVEEFKQMKDNDKNKTLSYFVGNSIHKIFINFGKELDKSNVVILTKIIIKVVDNNFLKDIFVIVNTFVYLSSENKDLVSRFFEFLNSKYVSRIFNKEILDLIYDFINSKEENDIEITELLRKIVVAMTNRKINTVKSLIASFYALNLNELRDMLEELKLIVIKSYNDFDNKVPQDSVLIGTIEMINKYISIAYKIADASWSLDSSFKFLSGAVQTFLGNILVGEDYDSNYFWGFYNKEFHHIIVGISNILFSPWYGVAELIAFCAENNISFWQWMQVHWKCVQENWATFFDPLNWFHSCIKQLIKEIKWKQEIESYYVQA